MKLPMKVLTVTVEVCSKEVMFVNIGRGAHYKACVSLHSLGRLRGLRVGAVLGIPVHVALAFMPWHPGVLLMRVVVAMCCRSILVAAISLGESSTLRIVFFYGAAQDFGRR